MKGAMAAVPTKKDLTPTITITRDPNCKIIGPNVDQLKSAILGLYPSAKIDMKDGPAETMIVECNNKVVWDKKQDGLVTASNAT